MGKRDDKRVAWDADLYDSLSDVGCLVCLSPRDKYVLGQALYQAKWSTRWDNLSGQDIDDIASRLEVKMTDDGCIDFCADVADCIDNDARVRGAIIRAINSNTDIYRDAVQATADDNLASALDDNDCDKDKVFAGMRSLVDRLHANNVDALQIIEVATNISDLLADVVGNITIIDETSIDAILGWVSYAQDNLAENYNAQVTQAYIDELTCDLFCVYQQDCAITPRQVFDYFTARLGAQVTFASLLDEALDFIVLGVWTGTEIADAMMLSQIFFRSLLGRYFNLVGMSSMTQDIAIGFNSPDSDWSILCAPCPDIWSVTYLGGDGDVAPAADWSAAFGVYDPANDWYDATNINVSTDTVRLFWQNNTGGDITLTRIRYDYRAVSSTIRTSDIRLFDGNGDFDSILSSETHTGDVTDAISYNDTLVVPNGWSIRLQNSCEIGNIGRILAIAIDGIGVNPFA